MKTVLAVLITCGVFLGIGTLGLIAWQHHQNRQLTRSAEALAEELGQAQEALALLGVEKVSLEAQLSALEERDQLLSERVSSLEAEAGAAAKIVPQPYRVRAFVGQDNVGGAWMIPHNITRDPDSGRFVFEPVLVIDDSARKYFTVHHTNVVEREVHTTEVYQDGYNYPYTYFVTPGRPGKPGRPPGRPTPPVEPAPVQPGTPVQPDANARLFAPPNSIVNSRPQVLGTPATSPINARMFAP